MEIDELEAAVADLETEKLRVTTRLTELKTELQQKLLAIGLKGSVTNEAATFTIVRPAMAPVFADNFADWVAKHIPDEIDPTPRVRESFAHRVVDVAATMLKIGDDEAMPGVDAPLLEAASFVDWQVKAPFLRVELSAEAKKYAKEGAVT